MGDSGKIALVIIAVLIVVLLFLFFNVDTWQIQVNSVEGGSAEPSGYLLINEGEGLNITAVPETDYVFKHWIFDGVIISTVNTTYNIPAQTVNTNHTLTAVFEYVTPAPIIELYPLNLTVHRGQSYTASLFFRQTRYPKVYAVSIRMWQNPPMWQTPGENTTIAIFDYAKISNNLGLVWRNCLDVQVSNLEQVNGLITTTEYLSGDLAEWKFMYRIRADAPLGLSPIGFYLQFQAAGGYLKMGTFYINVIE